MELFRSVNVDWLGKKWYFLAFSLIFSVAGIDLDGLALGAHRQPCSAGRGLSRRHAGAGAVHAAAGHRHDSPGDGCSRNQGFEHPNYSECRSGLKRRSADQPAGADQRDRARHRAAADCGCAARPLQQSIHGAQRAGGGTDGGPAAWRNRRSWRRFTRCWAC